MSSTSEHPPLPFQPRIDDFDESRKLGVMVIDSQQVPLPLSSEHILLFGKVRAAGLSVVFKPPLAETPDTLLDDIVSPDRYIGIEHFVAYQAASPLFRGGPSRLITSAYNDCIAKKGSHARYNRLTLPDPMPGLTVKERSAAGLPQLDESSEFHSYGLRGKTIQYAIQADSLVETMRHNTTEQTSSAFYLQRLALRLANTFVQ